MIRFTGRVNAFRNYAEHMKKSTMIPAMEDLNDFLAFQKLTVERKTIKSLGQWTSGQHKSSIPKTLQDYEQFAKFAQSVKDQLPDVLGDILQSNGRNRPDPRAYAVTCLKFMLLECCEHDATGNLQFIAQLIVSDLEEIFDFPFGAADSSGVIAGNGGANGYQILCNGVDGLGSLKDALDMVIEHVDKHVPEEHLVIAGYYRDAGTDKVCNIINGRIFDATDAEHFLCKGWVITKLTFGHYRNSKYPRSAKPHCHPERSKEIGTDPRSVRLANIMNGIISSYEQCCSQKQATIHGTKLLRVPQLCLMPGEKLAEQQEDCS